MNSSVILTVIITTVIVAECIPTVCLCSPNLKLIFIRQSFSLDSIHALQRSIHPFSVWYCTRLVFVVLWF